jgi:hypothetical protein
LVDPALFAAHLQMLPSPPRRPKGEVDTDLVIGLAKTAQASNIDEALAFLNRRELFAVLASQAGLDLLESKTKPARGQGRAAKPRLQV